MTTRDERRLEYLDQQEFKNLFIRELKWNQPSFKSQVVTVDGAEYRMDPVAEYRGIRVWSCGSIPSKRVQRQIDAALKKDSTERLLIFSDQVHQQWKWPLSTDSKGRGTSRLVTHEHYVGRTTQALLERLSQIEISMDEEPLVVEVVGRLRKAFDADRVTKSFYSDFSRQHEGLSTSIVGIPGEAERGWYAALLLNRLMFIYFMQRKGFMDGDLDYLQHRLQQVRSLQGPDRFFEFYTDFLVPLFHEGLGSPKRPLPDRDMAALIGDIPYVNGGIFNRHPLEVEHAIKIPDKAFEDIFRLFDSYQWHLDDRPTGQQKEINPDVLGYIFEQFINNKEQGAYYTKEDVTYFMTSSLLFPAFLERLQAESGVNPWHRLTQDPDRYIWDSLSYGVEEKLSEEIASVANTFPRPSWNELAPDSHALPGETWWEVMTRRDRQKELRIGMSQGQVASVDAALTANVDLETLTVDVIDGLDNPDDVVLSWNALTQIKIIDPTCGSGAFLFAALKILETLYMAILDAADRHATTSGHEALGQLLAKAQAHPSRLYFVLKHAALRNLYGVDIMNEAVEIARLRLFLKLVAAVEKREDLEPLPDLDFNIKPGNVLVGAETADKLEVDSTDLLSIDGLDAVKAAASRIAVEYAAFQRATEDGHDEEAERCRAALKESLTEVRRIVDHHYFTASSGTREDFDSWRASHQPFHWFIEFPEIDAKGGFDVVVGNPPYVGRTKPRSYRYSGFKTNDLPDIYAPCVERATSITNQSGRFAMILPISAQFADSFQPLRELVASRYESVWVSTFSRNPAALFSAGLGVRSTIIVGARNATDPGRHFTKTHRWYDDYRPALFETLTYFSAPETAEPADWFRPTSPGMAEVFAEASSKRTNLGAALCPGDRATVGFKQTTLYWLSVFIKDPAAYELDGTPTEQTKVGRLSCAGKDEAHVVLAVLLSKFAFIWWYATGDDFDVTQDGLKSTPVNPLSLSKAAQKQLASLGAKAEVRLAKHPLFTKYNGKWMGNYEVSQMRDLTDEIDRVLSRELGYEERLPDLEHAYYSAYKPSGDRPGTLKHDPFGQVKSGSRR
jgi:hypothetical protein